MEKGRIVKISGPLVVAEGLPDVKMHDVLAVGEEGLVGEVIELRRGKISVQVYEETGGLKPGDPVESTGAPLSVELGPGLVSSVFDGIQRPLDKIREKQGDFIGRGVQVPALDRKKKWEFEPRVKVGQKVSEGDIIGVVQETSLVEHRIMVPVGVSGKIAKIESGKWTVEDTVAVLEGDEGKTEIKMLQRWPVRQERKVKKKVPPTEPLITGQRVIDTFFPVAKGGTACVPGPFGSGKTVIQHQLSKWADADIIIFVACGERGNEAADVLLSFPKLTDPKSGRPLMERTILIANTSNMPVAAREASVYTGITLAEYYRDMGYKVALMADSTSRWAEALREISGRLEEMPGEEGYPAYLAARIAGFYERSGCAACLGSDNREGMISVIGSVSPPGGDLSDPVVQATLRMVKVFWSLEDKLAYQRHFPAINWLTSYSLYIDEIEEYLKKNIADDFVRHRNTTIEILQEEETLSEIVRLVGIEALSARERLVLETAKSIKEDFLNQSAFDPDEAYTQLKFQYRLLKLILQFHTRALETLEKGIPIEKVSALEVRSRIARAKFFKDEKEYNHLEDEIRSIFDGLKT